MEYAYLLTASVGETKFSYFIFSLNVDDILEWKNRGWYNAAANVKCTDSY